MAVTIGDFSMDGMNGDIQPPKPVFEHFTSLGDTRPYIQRLRSESKESQVSLWKIFPSSDSIKTTLSSLDKMLGIPREMTFDGVTLPYSVIILDYTISQKMGKSGWLVRIDLTLITSDETSYRTMGFGGSI